MADEVKDKGVSKWLLCIPVLLVVIGLLTAIGISASKRASASRPKSYPAEPSPLRLGIGEWKIKIYPDRWVGPIDLPENVIYDVDHPGEIEYFFWETGKRVLCKKGSPPQHLGRTPRSFWLRGVGEAVITVSPKD
jgi:hypothetical protein